MSEIGSVTRSKLIRAMKKAGFVVAREGSRHTILAKDGHPHILAVPRHAQTLGKGLVRDLIRDSGLTVDEFRALL